jgi:hypothetical protein
MIDSNDLYIDFKAMFNTAQGGFFPPQTVFIRAVNNISLMLWEKWTRQAEKSEEIKDYLLPFFKSINIITKPNKSFFAIAVPPIDFERFSSAKILVTKNDTCVCDTGAANSNVSQDEIDETYYDSITESQIEMIDNIRWSNAIKHLTKFPTFEKPKMTQIDGTWKVSPRGVSVVVLNYYIKPKPATFVYTTTAGNVQTGAGDYLVYDKDNSDALEWTETVKNEFLCELGVRFGLYTRDQFITAISSQLSKEK